MYETYSYAGNFSIFKLDTVIYFNKNPVPFDIAQIYHRCMLTYLRIRLLCISFERLRTNLENFDFR